MSDRQNGVIDYGVGAFCALWTVAGRGVVESLGFAVLLATAFALVTAALDRWRDRHA